MRGQPLPSRSSDAGAPAPRHVVAGTAGHIDHGKSTLVHALTGIDPDRLKEEKERGITIDIGFAHLALGPELTLGIVDVPGHERFVKNMLAGVGGIDLVMLVIAADEGVMPQTREHLAICQLLQVPSGLVVLTKADLAEPEWLELVREDVRTALRGTFLEDRPIVPVSAKAGQGLDALRLALAELARAVPPRGTDATFRLPIDRVFTIKGFGTVVTGTVAAGRLEVDERLEVYPRGVQAKVRGIQTHGQPVVQAVAGQRAAVNLQGLERAALERGDVLAPPGLLQSTTVLDATLDLLADAASPVKPRQRVRFHAGTSEVMARVYLLDRDLLDPGQRGLVQLRLEAPVVALPRDRYVVRSFSPMITIGGGMLLDVAPPRTRRGSGASPSSRRAAPRPSSRSTFAASARAGRGPSSSGRARPSARRRSVVSSPTSPPAGRPSSSIASGTSTGRRPSAWTRRPGPPSRTSTPASLSGRGCRRRSSGRGSAGSRSACSSTSSTGSRPPGRWSSSGTRCDSATTRSASTPDSRPWSSGWRRSSARPGPPRPPSRRPSSSSS